jgi:hypothetical protein
MSRKIILFALLAALAVPVDCQAQLFRGRDGGGFRGGRAQIDVRFGGNPWGFGPSPWWGWQPRPVFFGPSPRWGWQPSPWWQPSPFGFGGEIDIRFRGGRRRW